jgi:glycosyltransferase involved in cell wall biosynthesis
MKLLHWMKKENSGLARSTLELCKYEEIAGHTVEVRQPGEDTPIYGRVDVPDVHLIHSQLGLKAYHDNIPKIMWMHGEPLSSVGNGVSMGAIVDLAPVCEAFICMRKQEQFVWNTIKRTYLVPKGIDLDVYKPLPGPLEKLGGEPAILYSENWRRERNPLYICAAMQIVHKKYPNARLHLYNMSDKKMYDTFKALRENNKWLFIKSMTGPVENGAAMNELYNKADIVVSGLFPLYARSIEAFGAGKAFIGPGYREYDDYPWKCDLQPESIAQSIIDCWENYDKINYRKWAEEKHDVRECVRQSVDIYKRYI